MTIEAGRVISGRYRLLEPVGRGAQASVWVAEHLALGTQVAVKLIDQALAGQEEARERFRREATAAAKLRSAHVVQMLDHGIDGDQPFIVMELLEGEDLFQRIDKKDRLTLEETSKIITQVARALARAHAEGIVHRDLKPENVFLVPNEDDEIAKVLDFGVAKFSDPAKHTMTRTGVGTLIGTPHYMSPEQVKGIGEVDHRADLWAVGVIAYQCLTGELPFDSEGVGDLLVKITLGESPVPSKVVEGIPPSFDKWFAKACAREPSARFQSARDLATALAKAVGEPSMRLAKPPKPRGAASAKPAVSTASGVAASGVAAGGVAAGGVATPPPAGTKPAATTERTTSERTKTVELTAADIVDEGWDSVDHGWDSIEEPVDVADLSSRPPPGDPTVTPFVVGKPPAPRPAAGVPSQRPSTKPAPFAAPAAAAPTKPAPTKPAPTKPAPTKPAPAAAATTTPTTTTPTATTATAATATAKTDVDAAPPTDAEIAASASTETAEAPGTAGEPATAGEPTTAPESVDRDDGDDEAAASPVVAAKPPESEPASKAPAPLRRSAQATSAARRSPEPAPPRTLARAPKSTPSVGGLSSSGRSSMPPPPEFDPARRRRGLQFVAAGFVLLVGVVVWQVVSSQTGAPPAAKAPPASDDKPSAPASPPQPVSLPTPAPPTDPSASSTAGHAPLNPGQTTKPHASTLKSSAPPPPVKMNPKPPTSAVEEEFVIEVPLPEKDIAPPP